jgi:hypothetical protein
LVRADRSAARDGVLRRQRSDGPHGDRRQRVARPSW